MRNTIKEYYFHFVFAHAKRSPAKSLAEELILKALS